jgi:hypothetical protein
MFKEDSTKYITFTLFTDMNVTSGKLFMFALLFMANLTEVYAIDAIYPLVTYKCDPEADIVTLTNSLINSEEGPSYQYSDENGTYSPWNLVEINRSTEGTHIVRTKKITRQCELSSGEYTILLEPQVFNRDLDGDCGASISSAFTVSHEGRDIQQRMPFEDYCSGNSPVVTRVTVFGKTGKVKIKRLPRTSFY